MQGFESLPGWSLGSGATKSTEIKVSKKSDNWSLKFIDPSISLPSKMKVILPKSALWQLQRGKNLSLTIENHGFTPVKVAPYIKTKTPTEYILGPEQTISPNESLHIDQRPFSDGWHTEGQEIPSSTFPDLKFSCDELGLRFVTKNALNLTIDQVMPAAAQKISNRNRQAPTVPWTNKQGNDLFGPWADISIQHSTLRMRWVPPNVSFHNTEQAFPKGFWIAESEVPETFFNAVNDIPGEPDFRSKPQTNINWHDAQAWCKKLSAMLNNAHVELPTYAQLTHTSIAGLAFAHGITGLGSGAYLNEIGWILDKKIGQTHAVKLLKPNHLGIYDLHGNADEWTASASASPDKRRIFNGLINEKAS